MSVSIICDFDGTTAANDVGNLLFRTFADDRCFAIIRRWKAGVINSKACLEQECAITRASREQVQAFADSQELDPHFGDFVNFCRTRKLNVSIASDGLNFYIERILKNYGLPDVQVHANHLVFKDERRIGAEFPYFEQGCGACGNCKGYHVQQARESGDLVVYIGDGLSDRCGARAADIVFAKRNRDLIRFCREQCISHVEFDDFQEVLARIGDVLKLS